MTQTVYANGASGTVYSYFILGDPRVLTWHDVPVNYMFARRLPSGTWEVYYIGQCQSGRDRMPTHERWAEAMRSYGATHVLSHQASPVEATRCAEERDLILSHNPPMNTQHKPRGLFGLAG